MYGYLGFVNIIADSFSYRHEQNSFSVVWTPIRYVTLHFRDRRGVASLRYSNRAEITVLMCEQKPYPVWFQPRSQGSLLPALRRAGRREPWERGWYGFRAVAIYSV